MFWTYSGGFAVCYTTTLHCRTVSMRQRVRFLFKRQENIAPLGWNTRLLPQWWTVHLLFCCIQLPAPQLVCTPESLFPTHTPILKPCFTSCSDTHLFIHTIRGKHVTIKQNKSKNRYIFHACMQIDFLQDHRNVARWGKKIKLKKRGIKKDALYVILNRFESDRPLL